MEIIAGPLDWTSNDEQNLSRFLDTNTGKRLIPRLAEMAPILLGKGETNEVLIRMGEFKGRQETLRDLLILSHAQPGSVQQSSEYIAPEDDAAWNDGQTLLSQKEIDDGIQRIAEESKKRSENPPPQE
jgi:hypothetical protein